MTVFERNIHDYEYNAPGTFSWLKCDDCGLIRIDPMPSPELLSLAYPTFYHAYVTPKSKLTKKLIHISRRSIARKLVAPLQKNSSVLDVGCSTGELLFEMTKQATFTPFGVEFNPNAAREARKKGITVWEGDLDTAEIPDSSMDLVILQHVLEHVYNPEATLSKIYRILKPGGKVIGELPNIDSWDAKLFGRFWGGGHAPRHIWHFNPSTLLNLLKQVGLKQSRVMPSPHTGHWALSIQNWIRRNRTDLTGLTSGRAWYYPAFLLITLPINLVQMVFNKTGVIRFEALKE